MQIWHTEDFGPATKPTDPILHNTKVVCATALHHIHSDPEGDADGRGERDGDGEADGDSDSEVEGDGVADADADSEQAHGPSINRRIMGSGDGLPKAKAN